MAYMIYLYSIFRVVKRNIKGYSQVVRHQTLTLAFVGSNPAIPASVTLDPCIWVQRYFLFLLQNRNSASFLLRRYTSPQAVYLLRRLFYKSHRCAYSAASPFLKKVTQRFCCSMRYCSPVCYQPFSVRCEHSNPFVKNKKISFVWQFDRCNAGPISFVFSIIFLFLWQNRTLASFFVISLQNNGRFKFFWIYRYFYLRNSLESR